MHLSICLIIFSKILITKEELIPRNLLLEAADFYGPSLSPDGKKLSYIADIDKVSNIWVKDVPNGESKNLTYETDQGIYKANWLNDKTLIYQQDNSGDENYRLYSLNSETSDVEMLTDFGNISAELLASSFRYPDLLIFGMNDRNPNFRDIYEFNITTSEKTLKFRNDYFSYFYFDKDMQIRLLKNETDEGGVIYYKYNNGDGSVNLYREVDFENMEMISPLCFDATGKKMYWLDNLDVHEFSSLYEIDWITDEKKLIYEPTQGELTSLLFHPVSGTPVSVVEEHALPNQVLLDKAYKEDFEFLSRLTNSKPVFSILDYSQDFKVWLIKASVDTKPSAYYYYQRDDDSRKATFLFNSKESLMNFTYAPMHYVEVPIADNMTELCYLTLPVKSDPLNLGVPDEPVPMVLHVHGGPWTRDNWGFNVFVQFFANRGYAVLQCNFRSSTGFGKKLATSGYGQWGKNMQQDLTDAVNWAVENKIADPSKVAINGGSYGGYAVLAGLTFTPDLYACGIDAFGPSNLVTLIKAIPATWKPAYSRLVKRIGASPDIEEGKEFLENISPLFYADKIKKPLLIAHGSKDPRVQLNESRTIIEALKKRNVSIASVVFPNEGHGFVRNENRVAYYALIEQFLKKCLGGEAEPMSDDVINTLNGIIN